MWQEIIITDLTKMSGNKVCIAGITHKNVTIRPNMPAPGILEKHLYQNGQVIIRPGSVLSMNLEPEEDCEPPHREDHHWLDFEQTSWLRTLDSEHWKDVLRRISYPRIRDIFDGNLRENKFHPPSAGSRSLGTNQAKSIENFTYKLNRWGKWQYRLSFTDAAGELFEDIPITDLALRCYADNLQETQDLSSEQISEKLTLLFSGSQAWLRLGLTRPFDKNEKGEAWCYLQVNGIYTFPDYLEGKCFADFQNPTTYPF